MSHSPTHCLLLFSSGWQFIAQPAYFIVEWSETQTDSESCRVMSLWINFTCSSSAIDLGYFVQWCFLGVKPGTYCQTPKDIFPTLNVRLLIAEVTGDNNVVLQLAHKSSLVRSGSQKSDILHGDKQNIHFGPINIFCIAFWKAILLFCTFFLFVSITIWSI